VIYNNVDYNRNLANVHPCVPEKIIGTLTLRILKSIHTLAQLYRSRNHPLPAVIAPVLSCTVVVATTKSPEP
jgi:hypothetical protein